MKKNIIILAVTASLLAGCGASHSPIGLVDLQRLTTNWPQYANAQNQLAADVRAISAGRGSAAQKQRAVLQLQQKYAGLSSGLVKQIRDAATQVARQKNLKLVVTNEFVGYGGTDITPDVEKILGITEKATPTP